MTRPTYDEERCEEMDDGDKCIAEAPLPTLKTLRQRKNVPFQMLRFIAFNIRMLKMVTRAHH